MELSKDQMAFLSDQNQGKPSVEPKVELIDLALARYASKADGVTFKKLDIHHAERLAPGVIVATGRKGVKALAQNGMAGLFVIEFMQNQGTLAECVNELEKSGVKVEWYGKRPPCWSR
jgi:hypothetical protein